MKNSTDLTLIFDRSKSLTSHENLRFELSDFLGANSGISIPFSNSLFKNEPKILFTQ